NGYRRLSPAFAPSSLQVSNGGAEVDVQHLAIHHQGRNRLHAGGFGLGDAGGRFAQVHHLHVHLGGKQVEQGLFGGYADWAASVVVTSSSHFRLSRSASIESIH